MNLVDASAMQDRTGSLVLRRALGRARPEDYVEWAVEQLCDGADGPSLRILAGLSQRFDRDDIEHYFVLSCGELGVTGVDQTMTPLATARLIRRASERGHVPPAEALEMMADVHQCSEPPCDLLAPWYNMREELAWGDGYAYPRAALASVEEAMRREWVLLDRAAALALPQGWLHLTLCKACGHVGEARTKGPSLAAAIWSVLRRRPVLSRSVCARCGSSDLANLNDPDARSLYLEHMERGAEQELARFQGTWKQVAYERDGVVEPLDEPGWAPRTTFSGEEFVVTLADGSVPIRGTYRIDPTREPKTVDWMDTIGEDAGKALLAIYTLEGNRLTFCAAYPGLPRPTEFRTRPGQVLRALERVT